MPNISADEFLADVKEPPKKMSADEFLSDIPDKPITKLGSVVDFIKGAALEPDAETTQKSKTLSGISTELTKEFTPSPTFNPYDYLSKAKYLESAGRNVKSSVQDVLGRGVEKGNIDPITGTIASTATEFAPFTPTEFSSWAGMEIAPQAALRVIDRIPKSIANRFINATRDIAEGRLEKGEIPLGQEYLDIDGRPITQDKAAVFNWAKIEIRGLGDKIKSKINDLFLQKPKKTTVSTKELVDSIDPYIKRVKSSFGENSREARELLRFKKEFSSGKPEQLDFRIANQLREDLGEAIGKGFNKETGQLTEKAYVQKIMFAKLRSKIGEISPELSDLLNQQHILFDIKASVKYPAAKGFGRVPHDTLDLLFHPVSTNMRLAYLLSRTIPRGIGALGETTRRAYRQ